MKTAVIIFPGSNCDRDMATALEIAFQQKPLMIWHQDTYIPNDVGLITLPGGFSYGDYLRTGAMAAVSPIMDEVKAFAKRGVPILGVCNGFQILCECGLLPGAMIRNRYLKFICDMAKLSVENKNSIFTHHYKHHEHINVPIAHLDGCYVANDETLVELNDEDRIAFRYMENPNGSHESIAGIFNKEKTILGMMPHPERVVDNDLGRGDDGLRLFTGIAEGMAR